MPFYRNTSPDVVTKARNTFGLLESDIDRATEKIQRLEDELAQMRAIVPSCDLQHSPGVPLRPQSCTHVLTPYMPPGSRLLCAKTSDIQTWIVRSDGVNRWSCERHVVQDLIDAWQQIGIGGWVHAALVSP